MTPAAPALSPFSNSLEELIRGEPITIPPDLSVVQAARRMKEAGVGSLVVTEGGRPAGILTRTDLVDRVLLSARDPATRVSAVLTTELVTIEKERPIFDGLLLMIRHNISHLILTDGGQLAGVVSERDWLTFQERHPAALLRRLDTASSVESLAALRTKANRLVRHLFEAEGTAAALTRFVTEINDRVGRRVIQLALDALEPEAGPPPAGFAWIAMGSEGRCEQTLSTDQDNGLVFADVEPAETEQVRGWFLRLAARVVEGLEVCGFPRCEGNTMATNPKLCAPLAEWRSMFATCLNEADAQALLRVSIYFDFRCLYGESALVTALRDGLQSDLRTQRGFMRHLAGMIMEGRPPIHTLGWRVRSLIGLQQRPLDLKKQALAPLVAAVRALALACAVPQTNTLERLHGVEAAGVVPAELARACRSAYDYLMLLRIRQNFR
ncbi:MAG: DUF294 nucleotidyltransferase-like domain-containing protein, partial [bacterium]